MNQPVQPFWVALLLCVIPVMIALVLQAAPPEGWTQLGLRLAADGHLEKAVASFRKGCEQAPNDDDACYYLGRTLFALGRYAEAEFTFDKALRPASKAMLAKAHRGAALNFVALIPPEHAERHFQDPPRS